jgi:hypothetical protein
MFCKSISYEALYCVIFKTLLFLCVSHLFHSCYVLHLAYAVDLIAWFMFDWGYKF